MPRIVVGKRGFGIRHSGKFGGRYQQGSYRGRVTQDYARVNVVYGISFRREINDLKKKVWNWIWKLITRAVHQAFTLTGWYFIVFKIAWTVLERYIRRWFYSVIRGVIRLIAVWIGRIFRELTRPMLRTLRRYVPVRTGNLRNSIRIRFTGYAILISASVTWWYSANRGRTKGWVDRVMLRIFQSRWFQNVMNRVWFWVINNVPAFVGV